MDGTSPDRVSSPTAKKSAKKRKKQSNKKDVTVAVKMLHG